MAFTLLQSVLLEAPISIQPEDFNLGNDAANEKYGAKLRANPKLEKVQDLDSGFALYRLKNLYAVFLNDEDKLYYLMRYKTNRISAVNEVAATQFMVWSSGFIPGIARLVFHKYLLPEHKMIATDGKQTPDGQRFWRNRINEALKQDLWVYFADMISTPRRLIRITDSAQLAKLAPEIWGTEEKFRGQKILIADHQLKGKAGVQVED